MRHDHLTPAQHVQEATPLLSVEVRDTAQGAGARCVWLRFVSAPMHRLMLLDVTDDGAIVLRQAAVLPVEISCDARIAEFEREGTVSDADLAAARAMLTARDR
jgi:hypothetical protein